MPDATPPKGSGVHYDWTRHSPHQYRASYIMAFAAYNAGRGRVDKWVAQHGDPRDPGVDPVDWIERIPFAETRNYVRRVMENLQIYGVRIGDNG